MTKAEVSLLFGERMGVGRVVRSLGFVWQCVYAECCENFLVLYFVVHLTVVLI